MHVCRDRYTQKNLNDVLKRIILSKSKSNLKQNVMILLELCTWWYCVKHWLLILKDDVII